MQFPKILTKIIPEQKKKKASHLFLALEVSDLLAKSAVWEYSQKEGKIDIREIVKAKTADQAVLEIKAKMNQPVKKLILGLMPGSVHGDAIKKEEIEKIKPLAEKFQLTPVGFVVIPEAIAYLLKKEQETPQSAIFMGVGAKWLTLSLFRGGKSKDYAHVAISGNLFNDFEKGLSVFSKEEVLPSKIILYNSEEEMLEDIREELLTYPWQKNARFLHVPKIEILPWEFSIKAVVEAGASEISQSIEITFENGPDLVKTETAEKEAFGFFKDHDVVQTGKVEEQKTSEEILPKEKKESLQEKSEEITLPGLKPRTKPVFSTLILKLASLLPKFHMGKIARIIPLGFIFIVLGAIFTSSLYFYPSAKIKLVVSPKVIEQNIDIFLNPQISVLNTEEREIPGQIYTVPISGEKTQGTTGKKTIGEKAKGEITLYNKTQAAKTFTKGTIITGPSSLSFTLDEEAAVASASESIQNSELVPVYGKVKTGVTAVKIGPLGNVKKDNEFKIDDYGVSSFVARNEADFSGGTEREIDVVSSDDQDKLLTSLSSELKNQAKEKLESQVDASEKLLAESIKENIIEKIFDKEIGDEADNISLKLEVEFSAAAYKESELHNFLEQYVLKQVPSDYEFDAGKSYFNVKNVEFEKDGKIAFNADYYAYLLPKVDIKDFHKRITGKSLENLEEEVKNLREKGILGYEMNYVRRFPGLKNKLPLLGRNIEVNIVPY